MQAVGARELCGGPGQTLLAAERPLTLLCAALRWPLLQRRREDSGPPELSPPLCMLSLSALLCFCALCLLLHSPARCLPLRSPLCSPALSVSHVTITVQFLGHAPEAGTGPPLPGGQSPKNNAAVEPAPTAVGCNGSGQAHQRPPALSLAAAALLLLALMSATLQGPQSTPPRPAERPLPHTAPPRMTTP